MKVTHLPLLVFLIFISVNSGAQDIHFSQFWNTPLLQNPSFAGKAEGDVRVVLNQKSKWSSITTNPFQSIGANADLRFNSGAKDNHLGGGISMYSDVAGASNMRSTLVNLTAAYHLKVNEYNYLSAGLQAGIKQRSIEEDDLRFDNQFDGKGHNSGINSNENLLNKSEISPTVSAGISYMWSNDFAKIRRSTMTRKKTFNVGLALHHFNQAKMSFYNEEKLGLKLITNFEASFSTDTPWTIKPAVIFALQNKAFDCLFGSLFVYAFDHDNHATDLNNNFSIGLGSYYRYKDAFIPTFQMQYDAFHITFSYDVNLSSLAGMSAHKGGYEIGISYIPINLISGRKSRARFD